MTVLVIAPHPDDESIGCGGALRLHADRGDRVVVAHLTSGELGLAQMPKADACALREAEAERAAVVLGIARTEFLRGRDWFLQDDPSAVAGALARLLDEERPSVVFLPHPADDHPDHRTALECYRLATSSAKPGADGRAAVLAYEVWTPLPLVNHLIDVSPVMPIKLSAIGCYQSQLASFRYDEAVAGLNRYRGVMQAGWTYAEAYQNLTDPPPGGRTGLLP